MIRKLENRAGPAMLDSVLAELSTRGVMLTHREDAS